VISARHSVLVVVVIAAAAGIFSLPPIPQDLAYHAFADPRTMIGIPNALNVLSNIPFLIAGWYGLSVTRRTGAQMAPWEQGAYVALFGGTALTAFGSAYYHLAPDNARLVWDRLPMTLGFMGLLTAMLGERVSIRAARLLFVPLLALGAFSVALWIWTEGQGAGDLRLYGFVQFSSPAIVLVLVLYRPRRPGTRTRGRPWRLQRGKVFGARRSDLRDWSHRQRPHPETRCRRDRARLRSSDVAASRTPPCMLGCAREKNREPLRDNCCGVPCVAAGPIDDRRADSAGGHGAATEHPSDPG
jgi:hypothetical protein